MFDIDELAGTIDICGIGSVEPEIARMVGEAHRQGIDLVALEVLGDRSQPQVARLRAFGLVGRRFDPASSTGYLTAV